MVRSTGVCAAVVLSTSFVLFGCSDDDVGSQDSQTSNEDGDSAEDDETPNDAGDETGVDESEAGDGSETDENSQDTTESGDGSDEADDGDDGNDGASEEADSDADGGSEGIETSGDGGDSDCLEHLELDEARLQQLVESLSGEREVLVGGEQLTLTERSTMAGRSRVATWLQEKFAELDVELASRDYGSGQNLEAKLGPARGDFLVLSSHYDAPSASPGANDAAAVAVVLGITAALRECELGFGLRIVLFDEQELGSRGSTAYVENLATSGQLEELQGALNLDLLGYDSDSDGTFQVTDCGHPHTLDLRSAVADSEQEDMRLRSEGWCNGVGDHQAFWDQEKAAITLSQLQFGPMADANELDGTELDNSEHIDFAYLAELGALAGRSVLRMMKSR